MSVRDWAPYVVSQVGWFAGLIAAICMALIGQAELLPEPWRHWVAVIGIVATAIAGYVVRPYERRDR